MLPESMAKVPHRQVSNRQIVSFVSSARLYNNNMTEVIAMIKMQRSGIFRGVLYSYQSLFKELEGFSSDLATGVLE